jgi:glucose/arabinose dehydrogenase
VRALLAFALFAGPLALAQLTFQGSQQDAAGLKHHEITVAQMPRPFATQSAARPSHIISAPRDARLHLPPGFTIATYAEGFENPRWMALAPNGDVFVAESDAGRIAVLRDPQHTGHPQRFEFASGLNLPFGMAFHGGYFYVAETDAIVRYSYRFGQTRASGKPERILSLPGHGYNQHWTRDLLISPDSKKLFVSVGSQSNDSPSDDLRRAAILEFNLDGTGQQIFAGGLRNAVGIGFDPGSETLWATVNERDGLGDELPPDYFTSVQSGGFYGWPYAYIGPHPDPHNGSKRPDLVAKTLTPTLLLQAHSAPLGFAFYTGKMFPAEYRGDAFIAFHGSWNRSHLTGYEIVRVHFRNGKPTGGYDDFITGWHVSPDSNEAWGRPVGLLVLPDGSLLITDDGANKIWRVSYH